MVPTLFSTIILYYILILTMRSTVQLNCTCISNKSAKNERENEVSDTQHITKVSITAVYMREK